MNILFLTLSRLYDVKERGIYSDLMRRFVKDGHAVTVVVPFERRTGRATEYYESGGVGILGVKTLNIQKTNVLEKGVGTLLLERQYMSAIKNHLRGRRFDLVLYSTPPITFNKVIRWAKDTYGAHSYLLLKDIFPQNAVDLGMFGKNSLLYKLFRHKERELYRLSDYIGCMSPANADYILRHNAIDPNKVEVCPNSLELIPNREDVDAAMVRRKYDIPQDKVLCIYGGNLGKPQGVDFLIAALESNEQRQNCFFMVVGSGTEYPKLQQWFATHRPHNASLQKALPKADYDRLIRIADVGLIFLDARFTIPNYPSRLLSYLENRIPAMMATDKNTDIGTIAEANGYGFWAVSGDLADFDKKLSRMISDGPFRRQMGECGYQFLLDNYTVDKSTKIIMSHFR